MDKRLEAIALIAELDGCDRRSAGKQLLDLLGDSQLRIKWEEDPKPIRPVIGVAARDAMDWRQVRFQRNKVFDQQWTGRSRTLLIFRDDILRHYEAAKKDAVRGDAVIDKKPSEQQKAAPVGKRQREPSEEAILRTTLFYAAVGDRTKLPTAKLLQLVGSPEKPTQAWKTACAEKGVDPAEYPPPRRDTINRMLSRRKN